MAPASCDIGAISSFKEFQKLVAWSDVIHFHYPWPFLDILQLFNFSNKPTVLTYHSDIVKQKFLKKLYGPLTHRTFRGLSALIVTSPNYLDTSAVLRRYSSQKKVNVIPLGISRRTHNNENTDASDLKYLNRIGIKGGEYLLFLGVLRYYKGVHSLIQAAQSISKPIIIAGDGLEAANLRALAKFYQLNNVIFLGEVTEEQKHQLLRNCLALVLPSHLRSEAFGMVLIEAAMHAKPMVCCEIGSGTSYVNLHGVTGLVVPPENPGALADACNQLINDRELTGRMGQAALNRYEKLFSSQALGKAHVALYTKVISLNRDRV
jgi:rhamnosyl/mannosyltransferase